MVSAAPPATPAPSAKRRGVLLPVVGLVVLALCGLITIGIVEQTIGPVGVLVGTLCAMLPVVPVVATFLWVDRWEPEPPRLLLLAFAWGAGLSALVALLINSSASAVLDAAAGRGAGDLLAPVFVAPIVEEGVKGLFIVGLLIWRRREFDGVVDGIVYAGIVAAGFAFTENILYLGRTVVDPETAGVLGTLFMRGVASPFAHPLFTCMIGIGAGLAVASRSVATRALAVFVGYVVAVVLHGLWNAASVLAATPATFFQVYAFVMLPLFVALIVLVVFARRREAAVVTAELPGFAAAGWIAPSEVPLLADLSRRRGWRALVQRRSGRAAARAVAEYQAAVTELAFLRARIARGGVRETAAAEHDERLRAVLRARAEAVGMPDALTSAWRLPPPPGWQPPPPPEPDGSYTQPVRAPQGPYGDDRPPGAPPIPPTPPWSTPPGRYGTPGPGQPPPGPPTSGAVPPGPGSGHPGPGQSGPGQPGLGQPGPGQPGPGQPGLGQSGPGQPGLGQPGAGQPGPGQSGLGQPGTGQPGTGQPGTASPGPAQPAPGQLGAGSPGPSQPGSGQPGPARPGFDQPGPGQLGPDRNDVVSPGAAQPGPTRPTEPVRLPGRPPYPDGPATDGPAPDGPAPDGSAPPGEGRHRR